MTAKTDPVTSVWREVRDWPPCDRLALASKIVQSLETEDSAAKREQPSLSNLIGAWQTDRIPTDEEIERILEEERMRKHA